MHPDFPQLLEQGIALLEQLTDEAWTDFNVHDPGITILEQVCYALSDLSYRISYPLPDLLAPGSGKPGDTLFLPEQILPNAAVTNGDLRKLAVDVRGVRNAWIVEAQSPTPQPFYNPSSRTISIGADGFGEPLQLRGLHHILIDSPEDHPPRVVNEVWNRLHSERPLCEDFTAVRALPGQEVAVHAILEIGGVEDADTLLLTVLQRLADHIEPAVRFHTLQARLDAGLRLDEIYSGPLLEHGFVDDAELAATQRRDAIRGSDLIQLLMDIDGVRAVRSLLMLTGPHRARWYLPMDGSAAPRLAPLGESHMSTRIVLLRHGLPVNVHEREVGERYRSWLRDRIEHRHEHPGRWLQPVGRDRQVAHYDSIQYHFPAIYALAENQMLSSAPPARRAVADQLKAYLLLFEQLMANQFAQVARAGELFSADPPSENSYFAQLINDPQLGIDHLLHLDQAELQDMTESTGTARLHRFLNHLLARFGEQMHDYALVFNDSDKPSSRWQQVSLHDKRRFLRAYPQISSRRGAGVNILREERGDNRAGMLRRIRLKLGLSREDNAAIALAEHILLRPIAEDARQTTPLLEGADADPYSLQATLVIDETVLSDTDRQHPVSDAFIAMTVREETPAHLDVTVRRLPTTDMAAFVDAQQRWYDALDRYRSNPDRPDPNAHYDLRAARDRMIDLISDCEGGLGQTNPMTDLPISWPQPWTPYGEPCDIVIEHSQPDVVYQLKPADNDAPISGSARRGNGGRLRLTTEPIVADGTYAVHATKAANRCGKVRAATLQQVAKVRVGLNLALSAELLDHPFMLEGPLDRPASDAHICDYNSPYRVKLPVTQPDAIYQLVELDADGELRLDASGEMRFLSSPSERATGDEIVLQANENATEDIDIGIWAKREFVWNADHTFPTEGARLRVRLGLRVRANPDVKVEPDGQVVAYDDRATLQLHDAQASVRYQPHVRNIRDREMARDEAPWENYVAVNVPDQWQPRDTRPYREIVETGRVFVHAPALDQLHDVSAEYQMSGWGNPGKDGDSTVRSGQLQEDCRLLLKGIKEHRISADPAILGTALSEVLINRVVAVFVAPDPLRQIELFALRQPGVVDEGEEAVYEEALEEEAYLAAELDEAMQEMIAILKQISAESQDEALTAMTEKLDVFWQTVREVGADDPDSDEFVGVATDLAKVVPEIMRYVRESEHLHVPFRVQLARLGRRAVTAIRHPVRTFQQRRPDRDEEVALLQARADEVVALSAFLAEYEPPLPHDKIVGYAVRNGQPGVYYFFADGELELLGRPVYFHKKDDEQRELNKGIGQMGVEIDLVVAQFDIYSESADPTRTTPWLMLPEGIDVLAAPFNVVAVKAMTGVHTPMERQAFIVDGASPD